MTNNPNHRSTLGTRFVTAPSSSYMTLSNLSSKSTLSFEPQPWSTLSHQDLHKCPANSYSGSGTPSAPSSSVSPPEQFTSGPSISHPLSSRLCHRPHSHSGRALHGIVIIRHQTKDFPGRTRRAQTPHPKYWSHLPIQTICRVTCRDLDLR